MYNQDNKQIGLARLAYTGLGCLFVFITTSVLSANQIVADAPAQPLSGLIADRVSPTDYDGDGISDADEGLYNNGTDEVVVNNSGFEDPVHSSDFVQLDASLIPFWNTSAGNNKIEIWTDGWRGVPAYAGNQFAEINSRKIASMFQLVSTTPNTTLEWSIAHRGRNQVESATVSIGPSADSLVVVRTMETGTDAWVVYSGTYDVPAGQTSTRFSFDSLVGGSEGNFLDAFTLTAASRDSDNDGLDDYKDPDSDNDSIPDVIEGDSDFDNDDIPNYLDLDSDGDGILDHIEAVSSGLDVDGDQIDDLYDASETGGADVDMNGVDDDVQLTDTDNDNSSDYLDLDSDSDGIDDADEDSNSPALTGLDSDNDGIDDAIDVDVTGGDDDNNDGVDDALTPTRSDSDNLPDYRDTDSDDDGIPDSEEGTTDTDDDGLIDAVDPDSDNDGIFDTVEGNADTDDDGIIDSLDIDSDNDGILDEFETAIDTDDDGVPDYRDLDSDNDSLTDTSEAGGMDADGNGIVDGFRDDDDDGWDDATANSPLPVPDFDGDNVRDFRDLDSDNDGLSDIGEAVGFDSDLNGNGRVDNFLDDNHDGLDDSVAVVPTVAENVDGDDFPDHLDLDTDNDGLPDIIEAGGTDANGDGVVDAFVDENSNDIADSIDVALTLGDDANANGIDDSAEVVFVGGDDSDGDGIIDSRDPNPSGNGFENILFDSNGMAVALPDADRDGIPDVDEHVSDSARIGGIKTGLIGSGCSIAPSLSLKTVSDPSFPLLVIGAAACALLRCRKARLQVSRGLE